ncbi:MAG: PH domain-containing protein [Patescibacteria group bacterium]|nr:PH domain-containing protein [Patescibacteria group bacterium]
MKQSPHKIKRLFPFQREDEKVIMLLRRHWVILGRFIGLLLLLNLIPIVVAGFIFYFLGWNINMESPLFIVAVLMISFYYLIVWLNYFHEFVDFHLDIWIVTDQRIINIEQIGLFNRVISELNILKVQDVTSEVKGKTQTVLNYGNVFIQTAGQQQRFIFEQVKNPEEVARIIIRAHDDGLRKSSPEELVRLQQEKTVMAEAPLKAVPENENNYEKQDFEKIFKKRK